MSFLLPLLREASVDRHNKAVCSLRDDSLTVTITRHTEREIRALVTNGAGIEYGVTLAEQGSYCSCKDALYRGVTCKHALAVCISCLQPPTPVDDRIHLMWSDGTILCGRATAQRLWRNWTLNALNWSDIVCQPCVHTWTHPQQAKAAA